MNQTFPFSAGGERILEWDQNLSRYTLSLRGLGNEALREVTYAYNASSNTWRVSWEKDSIWAGSKLLAGVSRTEGMQREHLDSLSLPQIVTNRWANAMAFSGGS